MEKAHWIRALALNSLPRPDLLVTTMITPMGTGGIWLGTCVYVCVLCVVFCIMRACGPASLFARVGLPVCYLYVYTL